MTWSWDVRKLAIEFYQSNTAFSKDNMEKELYRLYKCTSRSVRKWIKDERDM